MVYRFYDVVLIIAVIQFLLLAFFLISKKRARSLSHKILAAFLIFKSLGIFNIFIFHSARFFYLNCPHVFYIGSSFSFLFGPCLYFYTRSMVFRGFNLRKVHLVHLVPFILYWIYMTFSYHIYGADVKREMLLAGEVLNTYESIFMSGCIHLSVIFYMIASFYILRIYRSEIKKVFSSVEHIHLLWLRFVIIGFIFMWMFGFANFIFWMATQTYSLYLSLVQEMIMFGFANIMVYRALKQPEIFNGIEEKRKYGRSRLAKADRTRYLNRLKAYMNEEKPYLAPSITIGELAKRLSIPSRYLSQIINESFGLNFFDFINGYRIEEAKKVLGDPLNDQKNILELLFDVGFNTKSVFNRVFKKHTGLTPTEFKRLHQV